MKKLSFVFGFICSLNLPLFVAGVGFMEASFAATSQAPTPLSAPATSLWETAEHIKVRLISETDTLAPDTTFHLGLELIPDPHWHVYWQNPGDSGMPINISWQVPENIIVEKQIWPIPQKLPFGDLTNYGYEGRVIIPVLMRSHGEAAKPVESVRAKANWLVCKDTCIPGSASLELSLKSASKKTRSAIAKELDIFINQEARPLKLMQGAIQQSDNKLKIQLFAQNPIFNSASKIEFFPINEGLFKASAKPTIKWKNNFLSIHQEKSENFYKVPKRVNGLLVVDDKHSWEFHFDTQSN